MLNTPRIDKLLTFCGLLSLYLFPILSYSKPLTINEAINLFLDNSFDVQIQNVNDEEAQAETQQFLGIYDFILQSSVTYTKTPFVSLFPFGANREAVDFETGIDKRLPFGMLFSLTWKESYEEFGSFIAGIPPVKGYTSTLSLSAEVSLLKNLFGKLDRNQITEFKVNELIAKLHTLKSIEDLFLQGVDLYQQWYVARQSVLARQKSLQRAKKLLKLNLRKAKDGLLEEGDIAQSRVGVESRSIDLEAEQVILERAEHALAAFVNLPKADIAAYETPEFRSLLGTYQQQSLEELKDKNIRVALSKANQKTSKLRLDRKRHDRMADLSLIGSIGLKDVGNTLNGGLNNLFFDNQDYAVGLQLNIPLGNGEKTGSYRLASLANKKAELEIDKAKKEISESYMAALTTMDSVTRRIEDSDNLVRLQKKKLKFEDKRFQQGRSSIDLILRFQDELIEFELQQERFLSEYMKSYVEAKLMDTSLFKENGVSIPKVDANKK